MSHISMRLEGVVLSVHLIFVICIQDALMNPLVKVRLRKHIGFFSKRLSPGKPLLASAVV